MAAPHHTPDRTPRRRADAERSIARILDAAIEALAEDHEASMSAIAKRAGVVRATIYVHFPTRETLIDAVTERAIDEVAAVIDDTEPDRGDPADAMRRIISAAWRTLGRYHALVAISTGTRTADELHQRHQSVLGRILPVVERGQSIGTFRSDVPASWHLAMLLALVHAAVAEVRANRADESGAEAALIDSALGAMTGPPA